MGAHNHDHGRATALDTGRWTTPDQAAALAEAARRVGKAVVARAVEPGTATEATAKLTALAELLETAPERPKTEAPGGHQGFERMTTFVATGRWPDPPPDGEEVGFDPLSYVSGPLSPFSMGAVYSRDGDEAVGRVRFTRPQEGPPGRAHGGAVASVFDEVMTALFRVIGLGMAYTGTLTVRFEAAAPLGVDVEFRARLASFEGRKHQVEGEATGPDGRFASASATFIEPTPEAVAAVLATG